MRRFVGVLIAAGLLGCGSKKEQPAGEATGSASATTAPAPTAPPVTPPPATPPPAPPPATQATDLPPLSADVLPKGEATPNTRVVITADFRYQVPHDFKKVELAGVPAYTGTVQGFGGPAPLTFSATAERFDGDLAALVEREVKAATDGGAPPPTPGPVMILVEKDVKQNYAKRMTVKLPDRIEQRTMVVHGGKAFIHRCSTPNVANAWANVGSDCVTRSTTFVVAPPPLAPVAAAPPPAAPETPNVVHLGNKLDGGTRKKDDVYPWIDAHLAPFVKPCLARLASGSAVQVAFQLDKEGRALDSFINVKNAAGQLAPPDKTVTDCIGQVVRRADIATPSPDIATIGMKFVVQ